jgi:hypothetical protein
MSDNLPAKLPARQRKEVPPRGEVVPIAANPPAPEIKVIQAPPSLPGTVLIRRQVAQFIRFAARITAKSTTPALRCCLFGLDSVVVTDLDVALRAVLPDARDIGVLVPLETLKRCVGGMDSPEIRMAHEPNPARPFAARVDGPCYEVTTPPSSRPYRPSFPAVILLPVRRFRRWSLFCSPRAPTRRGRPCAASSSSCAKTSSSQPTGMFCALSRSRAAIAVISSFHGKQSSSSRSSGRQRRHCGWRSPSTRTTPSSRSPCSTSPHG